MHYSGFAKCTFQPSEDHPAQYCSSNRTKWLHRNRGRIICIVVGPTESVYSDRATCLRVSFLEYVRVKAGNFGHQINSDIHFQTMEIQIRRLIRIFTVCYVTYIFSNTGPDPLATKPTFNA